jgi:segregation and condensation protein A
VVSAVHEPHRVTLRAPHAPGDAPIFCGSLSELALALRAGRVLPGEVPLLALTREVLGRVQALREERVGPLGALEAEVLPPMAAVVALKARLLLPRPAALEDVEPEEPEPEDVLSGVEALAELDALVAFLARRRREREGLIPARALDLGLPRRPRRPAGTSLSKLVAAARNAVREVEVPLLARERLSLKDALMALRAFAGRLVRFGLNSVPARDWGERTTYFTALLEGVRNGELEADQAEPFAPIEVRAAQVSGVEA